MLVLLGNQSFIPGLTFSDEQGFVQLLQRTGPEVDPKRRVPCAWRARGLVEESEPWGNRFWKKDSVVCVEDSLPEASCAWSWSAARGTEQYQVAAGPSKHRHRPRHPPVRPLPLEMELALAGFRHSCKQRPQQVNSRAAGGSPGPWS